MTKTEARRHIAYLRAMLRDLNTKLDQPSEVEDILNEIDGTSALLREGLVIDDPREWEPCRCGHPDCGAC